MKHTFTSPYISVIFPCFNEEKSIVSSVSDAKKTLALYIKNHKAEIIVVDNSSTDRSAFLAKKAGAKVIKEAVRGYGSALKTGFSKAKGDILIMADADNTYPLSKIPTFIREIQKGADMVLGSRFQGTMAPGAMPFFNHYIGNPLLTFLLNIFYGTAISDTQTGMRAITKTAWKSLRMKSDGMELASEMIIKAISRQLKISEIPIDYEKRTGTSKLSPLRDAIRHILSIIIYSPTYAMIIPGLILWIFGIVCTILLIPGPIKTAIHVFDIHSLITSILIAGIGLQIVMTGIITRIYTAEILEIPGGWLSNAIRHFITIDRFVLFGLLHMLAGVCYYFLIFLEWMNSGFGSLSRQRELFAASALIFMGTELVFGSIIFSLFSIQKPKYTHKIR